MDAKEQQNREAREFLVQFVEGGDHSKIWFENMLAFRAGCFAGARVAPSSLIIEDEDIKEKRDK